MGGKAMTARFSFGTPAYWRARAEESRVMADDMDDPEARRLMLDVAEGYDKIAKQIEVTTSPSSSMFSRVNSSACPKARGVKAAQST